MVVRGTSVHPNGRSRARSRLRSVGKLVGVFDPNHFSLTAGARQPRSSTSTRYSIYSDPDVYIIDTSILSDTLLYELLLATGLGVEIYWAEGVDLLDRSNSAD